METTRNLIDALMAAGLTQYRIAKESGVSQPTVNRIATGKHQDTTLKTHQAIKALADRYLKRKAKA